MKKILFKTRYISLFICLLVYKAQSQTVNTFAGLGFGSGQGKPDGVSIIGRLHSPYAIVGDPNLFYVADYNTGTIRKVTSGSITTFVNSSQGIKKPAGLALDASGNLYVADEGNDQIFKVIPAGVVSVYAGGGFAGFRDGSGSIVAFNNPVGIAIDANNNLYVADKDNHCIRMINKDGIVSTLAGNGVSGFADSTGSTAKFNLPTGVAISSLNLYVADYGNNRIRKISLSDGSVTTVMGTGASSSLDNDDGKLATINKPYGLAADNTSLYISELGSNKIRKLSLAFTFTPKFLPPGVATTLAGSGIVGDEDSNIGSNVRFNEPRGIFIPKSYSTLYIADAKNFRIRNTNVSTGSTESFIGTGTSGVEDTDNKASFQDLTAIVYDNILDKIYVADMVGNYSIREIGINSRTVKTIAGGYKGGITRDGDGDSAKFRTINGLCMVNSGQLLAVDQYDKVVRSVSLFPPYTVSRFAGTKGSLGVPQNGSIVDATFDNLGAIVSGKSAFLVGEKLTGNIRSINGANVSDYYTFDGTNFLGNIVGMVIDNKGTIYVASNSNYVSKIDANKVITRIAGGTTGTKNGIGSAAQFSIITGIAVDDAGFIYISDTYNNLIRKISPKGVVTTLAGTGVAGYKDGKSTDAKFNYPGSLALDNARNLYIADTRNRCIRVIALAPMQVQIDTTIATSTDSSVTVSWPFVAGATSYCLRIYKDKARTQLRDSICGITGTSYKWNYKRINARTEAWVLGDSLFYVDVAGVNDIGVGDFSELKPVQLKVASLQDVNNIPSLDSFSHIVVSPNPSKGVFEVDLSESSDLPVTITNLQGKIIYAGQLINGKNLLSVTVPQGIYVLKAGAFVQKIVIE